MHAWLSSTPRSRRGRGRHACGSETAVKASRRSEVRGGAHLRADAVTWPAQLSKSSLEANRYMKKVAISSRAAPGGARSTPTSSGFVCAYTQPRVSLGRPGRLYGSPQGASAHLPRCKGSGCPPCLPLSKLCGLGVEKEHRFTM